MVSEAEIVAQIVIRAFDALGIEYAVGGSVASTIHGVPRLTADVDLIAQVRAEHTAPLVALLESEFYIDADLIRAALADNSSFNIIHLPTMVKADIFIRKNTPFARSEWTRRERKQLGAGQESPVALVASAEDTVLQKLNWYRLTGERSDRQWNDVQGILKVQNTALDLAYLRYWADELNVSDLLEQALRDSGLYRPITDD